MKVIRCALILAIAVAIVGPHLAEAANGKNSGKPGQLIGCLVPMT